MNSQVTCSTNLTQVLAKKLYNFIYKAEKYPESYACKWKSLLSNFDSSLWELGVSNFS